jgi:hypothetical protein
VQTLRANIRLSPITIISGTLYETTLGKWIVEMIKHFTQLLGSDRLWSRICGISFCSVWVRIIKIWKFYGHLVSFLCPLNLLLNHWLPNIFGTSKWSKELELCGQSLLHANFMRGKSLLICQRYLSSEYSCIFYTIESI